LLDAVLFAGLEELVVVLQATLVFGDPLFHELAVLDLLQDLLHFLLRVRVDHAGATGDVAILGGLGDGEAHAGDALFIHEVADELQLVQALGVGHLGLITGLDEGLVTGLNEGGGAAAEHGLLAKEVRLGLFLEGGLKHAGAGAADALGPGEGVLLGLLGLVLEHTDEGGHAFAFNVEAADHVAGALGSDEDHVDVGGDLDQAEMNGEAVREDEGLALGEVGLDVLLVNVGLLHVGQTDEDDVGLANGLGGGDDGEAVLLGDGGGLGTFVEADDDLDAGVLQVEGVRVALGAVAEHCDGFVFEEAEVGVLVGVYFGGHDVLGGLVGVGLRFGRRWHRRFLLTQLGQHAGAGEFENAEGFDELEERGHLALVAGELDDDVALGDVDDLRAEDVADLHDLGAGGAGGLDLHEHELADDGLALLEVHHIDHVDELAELLDAEVERGVVALGHHGDAREGGIVGGGHVERVDVEAAAGKHAGDAG